jgi:predicted methyltransferase
LLWALAAASVIPLAAAKQPDTTADAQKARRKEDAEQRRESLRKLCDHLGVADGRVIADIGAGNGRDAWTFAEIVDENGTVYAEEIDEDKTKALEKEAAKRNLTQVKTVLGKTADPSLPAGTVDMAFMHHVYHHLSQPREMLQGIWKALKPQGYLVIVDRRLGTLVDWVPREDRAKKHYWIAETTVVREAREEGFVFVEFAEECWHAKDTFVLVFQRPVGQKPAQGDPDSLSAIPVSAVKQLLPPRQETDRRVAFVALGEGRKLIAPILEHVSCPAVDIVLEEWATRKDERPPVPPGLELPSVLTEEGDPKLGPEPIDAVYFLDTYHLLFHGPALLRHLRERLTESGCLFVLDRQAPRPISHREASHRRMIAPETVREEMSQAGFALLRQGPRPADDRFLLVFGKADPANLRAGSNGDQ